MIRKPRTLARRLKPAAPLVIPADAIYLRRAEAAHLLRVSPKTLSNLAAQHRGPTVHRFGGRPLYRRDELVPRPA